MEDNKIYVKDIKNVGKDLKLTLAIYDSKLPEFTTGSGFFPVIDEIEGKIIGSEFKEYQIPRPETNKIISVPTNYPLGHIEDLIRKEKESFESKNEEVIDKLNYFKDKLY